MKDNVDLTSNRDFRLKAKDSYRGAIPINMFSVFNDYSIPVPPGLHEHDRFGVLTDDYYINRDNGAVVQGNQLERFSKSMCGEFNAGNYCDCCGRPLKPYLNDCLCPICAESLDNRRELDLFEDFN